MDGDKWMSAGALCEKYRDLYKVTHEIKYKIYGKDGAKYSIFSVYSPLSTAIILNHP